MTSLLELVPLLISIGAYFYQGRDIYAATATLMVSMTLMLPVIWVVGRSLPRMYLLSTVLVLVFGTATLVLHDPLFIKWKPTLFLWLVGIAFLVSGSVGQQPLAQRLLQPAIPDVQLPRTTWLRLNRLWVLFYAVCGIANIVAALQLPEAVWFSWHGLVLGLASMLFILAQAFWLGRQAGPPAAANDP
jgi:intracellular septation protein